MITSIFNKSNPICFVIVFFYVLFISAMLNYKLINANINVVLSIILNIGIYAISLVLGHYIATKNKLTNTNNYGILLFSLLILCVPEVLKNTTMLWANFIIFIGIKQLFAMTPQNIKRRVFDASLFITIASLFSSWSILFIVLVYVTLFYKWRNNFKIIFIPFIAMLTVVILVMCYTILVHDAFLLPHNFDFNYSLKFLNYDLKTHWTPIVAISISLILGLGFYAKINLKKPNHIKQKFSVLLLYLMIAVLFVVLSPEKNTSEFLLILFPLTILITNYIELITKKWLKETILWAFVLLSISTLF